MAHRLWIAWAKVSVILSDCFVMTYNGSVNFEILAASARGTSESNLAVRFLVPTSVSG